MSLKWVLGHSTAFASGGRGNTVRADDGAVVTSQRLTLEYSAWTLEGWARIEAWPQSGSTNAQMALLTTNNAELLVQSATSGGIKAVPQVHVSDSAGGDVNYALTGFGITPSTAWLHIAETFSLANTRACVWLNGVVQAASTGLISASSAIYVARQYVGLFVNVGAAFAVDPSASPGTITLDNWRFSSAERYTFNTNFTPPTAQYSDSGWPADTTRFIWAMRDTALPYFIKSNFGREWGFPRLSAFNDRLAGPWAQSYNQTPDPV